MVFEQVGRELNVSLGFADLAVFHGVPLVQTPIGAQPVNGREPKEPRLPARRMGRHQVGPGGGIRRQGEPVRVHIVASLLAGGNIAFIGEAPIRRGLTYGRPEVGCKGALVFRGVFVAELAQQGTAGRVDGIQRKELGTPVRQTGPLRLRCAFEAVHWQGDVPREFRTVIMLIGEGTPGFAQGNGLPVEVGQYLLAALESAFDEEDDRDVVVAHLRALEDGGLDGGTPVLAVVDDQAGDHEQFRGARSLVSIANSQRGEADRSVHWYGQGGYDIALKR